MLTTPTLDTLKTLKLHGMALALEEQLKSPDYEELPFEERLGLLVDREKIDQENRRLASRLKQAKLRQSACMEDIDYRQPRKLDKSVIKGLASCRWIRENLNVILTGPTGVGKSYIACALGHRACMEGFKVLYFKTSRLFLNISMGRGDGSYVKIMNSLAKADLVILDDWGLSPMTEQEQRDLLEILDDRHGIRSTLVTSQLPIENWHETLGNPTLADAILDRLIHNAYKIDLKGGSMRKKKANLT